MVTLSIIAGILGGQEIILILIIVLVLFGGKKIPELMRGLGRGVSEFNKAKSDIMTEVNDVSKVTPAKQADPEKKEEQTLQDTPKDTP